MSMAGLRFADAWSNRVAGNFDGVTGHVLSQADLITNKRTVGRPQDLVDVGNLLAPEQRGDQRPTDAEPRKKRTKGATVTQELIDNSRRQPVAVTKGMGRTPGRAVSRVPKARTTRPMKTTMTSKSRQRKTAGAVRDRTADQSKPRNVVETVAYSVMR